MAQNRSFLSVLRWEDVREHYQRRVGIHRQLQTLHVNQQVAPFAKLLVGISNSEGNYSASEHGLGPLILSENPDAVRRLYNVATKFLAATNGRDVPTIIRSADLKYFRIGVGSEASCMLNPSVCWVANTRTIWAGLVLKHDSLERADEELELYRDDNETGEMAYRKWVAIHGELPRRLSNIVDAGNDLSKRAGVTPGKITYVWADAIANALYAHYHE